MAPLRLLGWRGSAPVVEQWRHEAGQSATVLTYEGSDRAPCVTVISQVRHEAIPLSPRSGIAATTIHDAMRAAVSAAVSIAGEVSQRDLTDDESAMLRLAANEVLSAAEEGWSATTVWVDGRQVDAWRRGVLDVAWAVTAELSECYLAAAGSRTVAPSELRFTTHRHGQGGDA